MRHKHLVYALAEGMNVRYVGYTAAPNKRRRTHAYSHPTWRWLLVGAFGTRAEAFLNERWWIAKLRPTHPLVNVKDGGEGGPLGVKRPRSTGAKISAAKMGHTTSQETRAKIAATLRGKPNGWLGRKHTAAAIANMRVAQRGRHGNSV